MFLDRMTIRSTASKHDRFTTRGSLVLGFFGLLLFALPPAAHAAAPSDAAAKTSKKKRKKKKRSFDRPAYAIHIVAPGDTLLRIAGKYGVSVDKIRRANRLKNNNIRAGRELRVPSPKRGAKREGGGRVVQHVVLAGETLGAIAKRYGTTVHNVRARNGLSKKSRIRAGRKLQVLTRMPQRSKRRFIYTIQAGDNFHGIAKRFGLTAKQLKSMNPRKNPRLLRIGHRLTVFAEGPSKRSSSTGRVSNGSLVNGEQLRAGPGYYRRTPNRSWGTNYTVAELLRAIAYVKQRHRRAHDLAIEHISSKNGGHLRPHKSHQSGRDVDMGVYFRKQPKEGPKRFLSCIKTPVDMAKTWTLLHGLVRDSDRKSSVAYIFWDYECQENLYKWAKKRRKPRRLLARMFQYPRGKRAMTGVIRHVRGHASHLHVRFKCPPGDKRCI